jgi:molybdate transport system substrate-binding protein
MMKFLIKFLMCCAVILLPVILPSVVMAEKATFIFGAASTQLPLTEAISLFEKRSGHKLRSSFAGSSTLAKQIAQGAPAGLFLSANAQWVSYLEKLGLISEGGAQPYLSNRLVVVAYGDQANRSESLDLQQLPSWLGDGRLALADPDHVPAGIYAKAALENMGLWDRLKSRIIRAQSVSSALMSVARGEAPLGIVYHTDVGRRKNVSIITQIPENSHPVIIYTLAKITDYNSPVIDAFYEFLKTPEGVAIFVKYGYVQLP